MIPKLPWSMEIREVRKLPNEKAKPEDLTASARSPVVLVVDEKEKERIAKEAQDKAKQKAERRKKRIDDEKAKKEHQPETKKEPEPKPSKKKAPPTFPMAAKVNKYGFLYLLPEMRKVVGIAKGAEAKIVVSAEGSTLIIKRI
jgi:hypothetical protein